MTTGTPNPNESPPADPPRPKRLFFDLTGTATTPPLEWRGYTPELWGTTPEREGVPPDQWPLQTWQRDWEEILAVLAKLVPPPTEDKNDCSAT